jgi:hypothetical protein
MRDRDHRPARDADAPQPAPPPPTPADLLELQRTSGNQAVGRMLSRLVYNRDTKAMHVPRSYADLKIPWDGRQYSEERDPRADDPTLEELVNRHPKEIKGHMAAGAQVTQVDRLVPFPDGEAPRAAKYMTGAEADQGTEAAIQQASLHHSRVLMHGREAKYYSQDGLDVRWMLLPRDYIPQAPDLPKTGTSVHALIPHSKVAGATYWGFVCVLIALVKQEGEAEVARVTNKPVKGLDAAVQALHDHYTSLRVPLQYDDTSTRFEVMQGWGYRMVFAGDVEWADLPLHVALKAGQKYIFDIKDHTVKVEVLQDVPKDGQRLAKPEQYFRAESDKQNYTKTELAQRVNYIWAK